MYIIQPCIVSFHAKHEWRVGHMYGEWITCLESGSLVREWVTCIESGTLWILRSHENPVSVWIVFPCMDSVLPASCLCHLPSPPVWRQKGSVSIWVTDRKAVSIWVTDRKAVSIQVTGRKAVSIWVTGTFVKTAIRAVHGWITVFTL